jgi:hypothetical protein
MLRLTDFILPPHRSVSRNLPGAADFFLYKYVACTDVRVGCEGSRESGRGTTAASERDSTAQLGSQRPVQGSASKGLGDTASSHQTGSESRPRKRPVRTVASRIVSVLGAECGLDPTTVLLSEVSDWMEQSAHVIRICGDRYTPPHKWSHLR